MTKGGGTLGRSLLIPFSFMPKKQKSLQKKGFFLWRRERDSSGDTGAVSPPARGTKKPFTGWFFALPCSAVPFSSLSLLCLKSKNPFKRRDFSFGAEKGIRTLVTVPRKHDFQSCALDQLSHLCKPLDYNTPFYIALQAKFALAPPKALSLDNPARARQNYARIICGG